MFFFYHYDLFEEGELKNTMLYMNKIVIVKCMKIYGKTKKKVTNPNDREI